MFRVGHWVILFTTLEFLDCGKMEVETLTGWEPAWTATVSIQLLSGEEYSSFYKLNNSTTNKHPLRQNQNDIFIFEDGPDFDTLTNITVLFEPFDDKDLQWNFDGMNVTLPNGNKYNLDTDYFFYTMSFDEPVKVTFPVQNELS